MICAGCGEHGSLVNGRECSACFRHRLRSISNHYHPTDRLASGAGVSGNRRFERRLADYASARKDGIQPRSTRRRDIDQARAISDVAQDGFRADAVARAWEEAS